MISKEIENNKIIEWCEHNIGKMLKNNEKGIITTKKEIENTDKTKNLF